MPYTIHLRFLFEPLIPNQDKTHHLIDAISSLSLSDANLSNANLSNQPLVELAYDALVRLNGCHHLLLGIADPESRGDLLHLLLAVDLLRHALDLAPSRIGRLPDLAELVEGANVQPDLLAEVGLIFNHVEGPLGQVDDGREGYDAREEVRMAGHGNSLRDHLADLAGRRDSVFSMGVVLIA